MAVELGLLWTCICGIVAICFLWNWWMKKPGNFKRHQVSREDVLKATNKRILEAKSLTKKEHEADSIESEQDPFLNASTGNGSNRTQGRLPGVQKEKDGHLAREVERGMKKGKLDGKNSKSTSKKEYHVKLQPGHSSSSSRELDPATSLPIAQPLKDVGEVFGWIPGFDHFNVASIPLRVMKRESEKKPKTLICHDMKGGYTDDRFIQGINSTTCYRIDHWNFIDTFVYFSHNLVTIPPPCWTNVCHRHGVKVLGTFITEWDDGAKLCSDILETDESYKRFAKQLVDIAIYYGFDGWLVNIENQVPPEKISNLIAFLDFLTKSMHKAKAVAEVIWYDSITIQGELKWQNELNGTNSAFFDVCDGIFLNYAWSLHHLSRSAIVAGNNRKFDVYVGVDCFGRGCFGGGGWNTYKALQVIREQNLSAAIFAPGWVLETQGEENFNKNQKRFWHLISSYLFLHLPEALPITSSFCQGFGNHYFSFGKKIFDVPWTQLSCQQLQPSFNDEYYQLGPREGINVNDMMYCTDDAFEGGGCFKINGLVDARFKGSRVIFRLFKCDCRLPSEFIVSLSFKLELSIGVEVYLLLLLDGKPNYVILGPNERENEGSTQTSYIEQQSITVGSHVFHASRQNVDSSYVFPEDQRDNYIVLQPLSGKDEERANELCTNGNGNSSNWRTRFYLASKKKLPNLREVRLVCTTKQPGL